MTDHKPLTKKFYTRQLNTSCEKTFYAVYEEDRVRSAVALAKANLSTILLSDAFREIPTIKLVEALDSIDAAFPVFKDEEEVQK